MSQIDYPPIASIFISIIAVLILARVHIKFIVPGRFPFIRHYYLDDEDFGLPVETGRRHEFGEEMDCWTIGEEIEFKGMREIIKDLGANSLKRLIECNLVNFELPESVAFLHEFADWSTLNSLHPNLFTQLSPFIQVDQATTQALKSFPVQFLVQKIKKLGIVAKLPMNQILTEIIKSLESESVPLEYLNFWKLFNSSNSSQLDPTDQPLLMKYFSLLGNKLLKEDFLLWLVKSESFLISSLLDLRKYNFNGGDGNFIGSVAEFDNWMEMYSKAEIIVEYFIKSRLNLAEEEKYRLITSKLFRKSLIEASIGKIPSKSLSDLTEILMEPKPVDLNVLNNQIVVSEPKNFLKMFKKLYRPAAIFTVKVGSFKEFLYETGMEKIESRFVLLELLKWHSNDEDEILFFIRAFHEPGDIISFVDDTDFDTVDDDIGDTFDTEEVTSDDIVDDTAHDTTRDILDDSAHDLAHDITNFSTTPQSQPQDCVLVYDEECYVEEWIKLSFRLQSPAIANFFINHYARLLSTSLSEIVMQAKTDGHLRDLQKFYGHPDTGMAMKAALMTMTMTTSTESTEETMMQSGLLVDFLDLDDEIQLLTTEEVSNVELESGKLKREKNEKIRRLLKESFNYFLNQWKYSSSYKIAVTFKEMAGQDTGGLSRHFVSLVLKLLLDEGVGLFHRIPDTNHVVPRTLLDANVMGFVGMLHGQCLKLGIKAPWLMLIDLDCYQNILPSIKLIDLINEISGDGSEGNPSFEDILVYVTEEYKLFEDRFDFSHLPLSKDGENLLEIANNIEIVYLQAGTQAYINNLLRSLDPAILKTYQDYQLILGDIFEIIKPHEIGDDDEFMECFEISNENMIDKCTSVKVKEAVRLALNCESIEKSVLIPKILKFVTGSSASITSTNSILFFVNVIQVHDEKLKRLPRASTCTRTIHWTVEGRESVEEMKGKFLNAVLWSQGFDLI